MTERTAKDAARAVWGATPAGAMHAPDMEPGTAEYLAQVLRERAIEIPWLTELVDFASFRGLRVLEVGCGAGYDAIAFAKAGASYVGLDIAPENIERTQKHLALAGCQGEVIEGDAEALPFPAETFDAYYSNGVLHHVPDIGRALAEAYRVLRPGGELWLALYNRRSLFYQVTLRLEARRTGRPLCETLQRIEATTSSELPLVNVYSPGEVRRLLERAGLRVERTWVRRLDPEDLPRKLAWLPGWLGRWFGWYVVARAKKPAPASEG